MASEGGFVIIDSILRRGISHEYEGVLDLYLNEQGIVIVNELPLEDYVSKGSTKRDSLFLWIRSS